MKEKKKKDCFQLHSKTISKFWYSDATMLCNLKSFTMRIYTPSIYKLILAVYGTTGYWIYFFSKLLFLKMRLTYNEEQESIYTK